MSSQTWFQWRPLLASVSLMLVLLAVCLPLSCKKAPPEPVTQPKSLPRMKPLLEGWSDPRAVLVFTGDEHGYMEPCGCSERQSGGFARRGDLLRQIREERSWPATAFNVGGTLYEPRVGYRQSLIKFSILRRGLSELGFEGMALGKEELMLGPSELYNEHVGTEELDLPFLAANVTLFGTRDLGTPADYRIVEIGDMKVGVTAIVGDTTRRKVDATGLTQDETHLRIDAPAEVLPRVLEELQAEEPDLLVLLSHAEVEESRTLAAGFPDFDIVVTSGSAEDPRLDPEWVGETLLVLVGRKGKHAAVVGVFPDEKLRLELVELDMDRFDDLPAMHELMRDYQAKLEDHWDELSQESISDLPQGTFVGVNECKTCHTFAYAVWEKSHHAQAYKSLVEGRPEHASALDTYGGTEWIPRNFDPECLCCHTTGWDPQRALRYESGFLDMDKSAHLAGQQCENCHGPGSEHVAFEKAVRQGAEVNEEVLSARKAMQLTLTQARNEACIRCHDPDNSPNFDFDRYWPKINHSGRKD
jgi:hypothetical protein